MEHQTIENRIRNQQIREMISELNLDLDAEFELMERYGVMLDDPVEESTRASG